VAELLHIERSQLAPVGAETAAAYDLKFVPPSEIDLLTFSAVCSRLLETRQQLDPLCQKLGITALSPVVAYQPSAFLREHLTAEQTAIINECETPAIAGYCLEKQDEIARVPIVESMEPLVHLPSFFASRAYNASFSDTPFHEACGEWAGKPREFWVRKGLAERLGVMSLLVGSLGLSLHFEDAFRPVGVQEGLFKRRVGWTRDAHTDWNDDLVIAEARSKTAVTPRLASHKGGAAVDAQLRSQIAGFKLDIGHNYPDGGALVFPESPFVTAEQWRSRQIFQIAASLSGLKLYVGEDWHVSYGDNLAALDQYDQIQPGYVAQYGPIKDFNRSTGEIIETYAEDELDQVFAAN
jgi:D-alanyl-D-alanine dipeptidase